MQEKNKRFVLVLEPLKLTRELPPDSNLGGISLAAKKLLIEWNERAWKDRALNDVLHCTISGREEYMFRTKDSFEFLPVVKVEILIEDSKTGFHSQKRLSAGTYGSVFTDEAVAEWLRDNNSGLFGVLVSYSELQRPEAKKADS